MNGKLTARGRFTPAQARLADAVTDYRAAFAATGRPGRRGLAPWPAFGPAFGPGSPAPHTQSPAPDAVTRVDYAATRNLGFWRRLG
ncbi:hypothetical protein ACIG0D_23230 [Streptomyces sp. NPDC052773]|uniref:hypothetical protein n=1 Tax=Streptomyces sp. NPDC052773 TaxID=3365693 RepID=UPI0037CFD6D8